MAPNPFVGGYRPETDTTDPLDPDRASYYQTMIGVMRWIVEIGRKILFVQISQQITHIQAYIRTQERIRSYTENYLHRTKWPIDRPTNTAANTATASAEASADAPDDALVNTPA